jgi:hypothetical protein
MVDAVLLFGAMNVLFEFVLLSMLAPRTRLRVLGSPNKRNLLHVGFLLLNLMIHWGTVVGTMSAVMAFISSLATVQIAMKLYGFITDGRYYTTGWIKYGIEELR